MPPPTESASDWERLLSTAARLQRIVPEAVLVGGTATGLHVAHWLSKDDGHVRVAVAAFDAASGGAELDGPS